MPLKRLFSWQCLAVCQPNCCGVERILEPTWPGRCRPALKATSLSEAREVKYRLTCTGCLLAGGRAAGSASCSAVLARQ